MSEIDRRDMLTLTAGSALLLGTSTPSGAQQRVDVQAAMHGIEGVSIPPRITVLGTGGSGCWPALFAAMCGVQEMLLIDASDVSADDMGRTCFRPQDIGIPKTEALAEIIRIFRPDVILNAQKRFVEPDDDDIYFGSVLFDGVDYKPLNKILPIESEARGMIYVQGFYKGLGAGVSTRYFDEIEWTRGSDGPVWPASAALCGILQLYAAFSAPLNFSGQPSDWNMSEAQMVGTFVNGMSRPVK